MHSNFLLFGLPRSRTFWFSKLFTGGDVFCYHELSAQVKSVERMARAFDIALPFKVVGNSDSAQILVLDKLLPLIPRDTRYVFIRRDRESALSSYLKAAGTAGESGGTGGAIRKVFEMVDAKLDHWQHELPGSLVVHYDMLKEPQVVREVFNFATDGVPFPEERFEAIRDQRLTIPDEAIQDALANPRPCAISEAL